MNEQMTKNLMWKFSAEIRADQHRMSLCGMIRTLKHQDMHLVKSKFCEIHVSLIHFEYNTPTRFFERVFKNEVFEYSLKII